MLMKPVTMLFLAAVGSLLTVKTMANNNAEAKKKVETRATQSVDFAPGGDIQLDETIGDVSVVGWDKPQVELTVLKATKKLYGRDEHAEALKELERFSIVMSKESGNRLLVSATAPSRSLLGQLLKGGTNIELSFILKVPQASNLDIKHKAGDVNVNDIKGNISISNHAGDVGLALSGKERYVVDAKCRLGEVASEFKRKEQAVADKVSEPGEQSRTFQVYLRVDVGEIRVAKLTR
jgi:hypothetical protein